MKGLLICLLIAFFAGRQHQEYTIGEVLRRARQLENDSTTVKIAGYITRKLKGDHYLFEDRTAEVEVAIENRYLPEKPVDDQVRVVIYALVQYEINHPVKLKVTRKVTNE